MTKIIALAGNPNSGKTSLFNELTGANQSVGNWPGVTVERKEGHYKKDKTVVIQDLPGIYSLAPYTPEEVVARHYLLQERPDAILNVVDGTNLERNLYLSLQLMDLGIPVVIALNMMDVLKKQKKEINLEKLAYGLGVQVVGTSAVKRQGLEQVTTTAIAVMGERQQPIAYDPRLETALSEIGTIIEGKNVLSIVGRVVEAETSRWYSMKLFERDPKVIEELGLTTAEKTEIDEIVTITEKIFGDDSESILINERYDYITKLVKLCVISQDDLTLTVSDKLDRIVTNRFLALPIFAFIMWLVYYVSIQTVGTMGTDWVNETLFGEMVPGAVAGILEQFQVAEWMQSLILDGILAGVGAVLGFVPQLIVLFLCLALLEDCGYMSRIAFVMDRLFRRFGMSGKSFIPMLIATGCGVPGVMASRTIENEKDRKITIMVTTFMPCSAKLPIIALIAGAFFPHASWVAPSAYFIGMSAIVLSGIVLKKTKSFAGDLSPFIMELPAYHLPRVRGVLQQTWHRSSAFVKKAGTIIFVSSILIWFLSSFNLRMQMVTADQSILANLGNLIAFIFIPLGWGDWRATVATVTGLIAKENVVNTFGILFGGFSEVSEAGNEVWPALRAAYTPVAAYSFLVFNLLCAPCFAAIGAIHREMANLKWTLAAVGFQCGVAYLASFVVYQLGHVLLEGGTFGVGAVLAIGVIFGLLFLLIRKPKNVVATLSTI